MRVHFLVAAVLVAGCGTEPGISQTEEAICRITCGQCLPDSSSPTGGSKTCTDCSGDSYTTYCRPVCTHNVVDIANAILPNPIIVSVYWGSYFTGAGYGDSVFHEATWYTLAASTNFWSRMAEYGINVGSYGGGYYTNAGLSSNISDADIRAELCAETLGSKGGVPPPAYSTQQVVYLVYLPDGVRSTRNVGTPHTGYHDSFYCSLASNPYVSWLMRYAVVEGMRDASGHADPATVDLVAAHEMEEAATDADLNKGWIVASTGDEIADLCAPRNEVIDGRTVPTIWSQRSCTCK